MPSLLDEIRNPAIAARYGAENLNGVDTVSPADYTAARALKAAVALGGVTANAPNALVRSFQLAYNADAPTVPLKVDGYWGPKTKAALAEYDTPAAPVPAAVANYSPPPPQAPTPFAAPVANLRQAAASLSPQSSPDEIRAFQIAWNASGGVPTLAPDGRWGPMTASAVGQALGRAPRVAPPPTFVSPPATPGGGNTPSLPVGTPTDPRPMIAALTVFGAGVLLVWAPWKKTGDRDRVTVPAAPRARRRA